MVARYVDVIAHGRTRGGKYEITLTREANGQFRIEEATSGRSSGVSTGIPDHGTAISEFKQRVELARRIDGIRYHVTWK